MWAYVVLVILLLLLWKTSRTETKVEHQSRLEHQSSCNTTPSNIKECEESIRWLRDAIDEDTRKYNAYLVAQQNYNNSITAWNAAHNRQLQLLEEGRRTNSKQIWHNNQKYDCETGKYIPRPGQMVYR
jgi:hypothetical protein